ncbi:MAG: TetR family transcriptional regulator [Sphingomonadales bacterium]|nr:TetR family transcriptional regulator [Sphingomonadales bacterium]MDE2169789.1 TetR family transcriptional regulator [Sphingomonadales bacterium]
MTGTLALRAGQDRDRADRRAAIADAAIDILGEQGSRGLTHRAIDKHLGYPEGTTSAYFRRREDLVVVTIKALFDADFRRINLLFDTLLAREAVDLASVAQWFARMLAAVRQEQGPVRMLARYECFLMAKRNPDTDRLLRASFDLRTERTEEVFRRLGAANARRAAIQFEILLRGAFFTASFMPEILDDGGAGDQAFFLREIAAAMQA